MKTITEDGITRNALGRISGCPNPRLKEVVRALTRHLHDFAREVDLTPEEWLTGIQFLTEVGHLTDHKRQEFILLSDTLGLSALVDIMAHREAASHATDSSLLGPFFRDGAPELPDGANIARGASGEALVLRGRVLNREGEPIAGASVDTWQASAAGLYDLQEANSDEMNFRGRFRTDKNGHFSFRSVKPAPYTVPADGPVGKMLAALARSAYRPAHIHFTIAAPGYRTLTTALYIKGDRYLDLDAVFGARKSLVVAYRHSRANGTPGASIEFDFVLASGTLKKKRRKQESADFGSPNNFGN